MPEPDLTPLFDKVVAARPNVMKAFMRGFTLSNDYDATFDKLIQDEEQSRGA